MIRLSELAHRYDLELRGADREVQGIATLERATPEQLSFFTNPRYRAALRQTRAAAVILAPEDAPDCPVAALISRTPYADYARIATRFCPPAAREPGIHPSAVIEPGATIDPGARIDALCHIASGARVAAGAWVGPGSVIGPRSVVGPNSTLVARVTLVQDVRLGARVLIHPGAVLGADGFGLAPSAAGWIKVPQLGGVVIGDDCEIGANSTIDRGALDDTVLEEDVRLDNQVQIGHGARIGAHTAMAAGVLVAGSARIGRRVQVGGGAGINGHVDIADGVIITAFAMVTGALRTPGAVYSSGLPAVENALWKRSVAALRRLARKARPERE
jgi:UDP-3-O-[3-hydroxymyristoyl] glucosamine N-acyltransferase